MAWQKPKLNKSNTKFKNSSNSDSSSSSVGVESSREMDVSSFTPAERRAVNYLIKKYLLDNGYKLTAISFAEEVCFQFSPHCFSQSRVQQSVDSKKKEIEKENVCVCVCENRSMRGEVRVGHILHK